MRTNRYVTGTGLVIGALAVTLAALLFPLMSSFDGGTGPAGSAGADLNAQTVSTQFGPMTALDKDFLIKVRLAGLWELPAGQQAQQRGSSQAMKRAGQHLIDGHTSLDAAVRETAPQLGVQLPNEATDQQKGWLAEMTAASGAEYERKFANILRLAHGKVFTVIAEVRATTRNSLVRELANQANVTVLDHITVLEETGLVDFDAIAGQMASNTGGGAPPAPPAPAVSAPLPAAPVRPVGTSSPDFSLPPAATAPTK